MGGENNTVQCSVTEFSRGWMRRRWVQVSPRSEHFGDFQNTRIVLKLLDE